MSILRRGTVLYLAMVDGGRPYVLPLSYGYDGSALYLHCAPAGRFASRGVTERPTGEGARRTERRTTGQQQRAFGPPPA